MKRYIRAFTFRQYNANPRGTIEGDCQTRAISLALDIPYKQVSDILSGGTKRNWATDNSLVVRSKLIKDFGCREEELPESDRITIREFADAQGKNGTYILSVGEENDTRPNHLTCVIDGTLYDTWDSSNNIIFAIYYPPKNRVITDNSDLYKHIFKLALNAQKYVYDKFFDDIDKGVFDNYLSAHIADYTPNSVDFELLEPKVDDIVTSDYNFILKFTVRATNHKPFFIINKSAKLFFKWKDFETTYEEAAATLNDKADSLYNNFINTMLSDVVDTYKDYQFLGKLRSNPKSKELRKSFVSIPEKYRSDIVDISKISGYTSVEIETDSYLVKILSKTASLLNQNIQYCMDNLSTEDFDKIEQARYNVAITPYGFIFTQKLSWYHVEFDDTQIKELLNMYSEYEEYHEIDNANEEYYLGFDILHV